MNSEFRRYWAAMNHTILQTQSATSSLEMRREDSFPIRPPPQKNSLCLLLGFFCIHINQNMRERDKNNYRVFPIKHFFGSVSWCCRACDVNWTLSCSVVAGGEQQNRSSWGIVILGLSAKSLCVFMPLTLHIYLNMLASQDSCFLLSNAAAKDFRIKSKVFADRWFLLPPLLRNCLQSETCN